MFIGSAVAFTLYMFVLKQLSATASSIYTYINPAVAVFLGWLWLGESMSLPKMMGMCITLAGVWLVNKGESQKK
jgi:drug/metabolite transporter (DMT)-like permease